VGVDTTVAAAFLDELEKIAKSALRSQIKMVPE
jgi:hypothetical protein